MRTRIRVMVLIVPALAGIGALVWSQRARFDTLDVPPGRVAILLRRDGREPPPGSIIAPRTAPGQPPYRGIVEDVLPPGRHDAINRHDYDWQTVPLTVVPTTKVGVLVRLFGEDLPAGQTLADENPADAAAGIVRKGILREPLAAGSHAINLRAYRVLLFDPVVIQPGQVGVVAHLVGRGPSRGDAWLAAADERGVQAQVLPPGIHHVNPFATFVLPVSRQSQRLDLTTPGTRVRFPTSDGFDIALDGAIEWSLTDASAPLVYVKFGGTKVVEDSLILPAARAISRSFGARSPARDFIAGTSRQSFQSAFETELRRLVEAEGPVIHAVTISGITPPNELATLIQRRVEAALLRSQIDAQMETERGRASLAREQELEQLPALLAAARATHATEFGVAREAEARALATAAAEDEQAQIALEIAKLDAERIRASARSSATAKARSSETVAAIERKMAAATGGGDAYARLRLLERLIPHYRSIVATLDAPPSHVLVEQALDMGPDPESPSPTDSAGSPAPTPKENP